MIAGQSGIFRTSGTSAEQMAVRFPAGLLVNLGEIPKHSYTGKLPQTRMGTANLLRAAFAPAAIEIEELPDLGERKADRLRPKNELQACSFPPRIDAAAVDSRRRKKPLRLVEADSARRDPKLAGKFRDAVEPLLLGEAWAYVMC